MPGACLSLWPTEQCEWSTWDIWRSWDYVQRGMFIVLALMLAYTVFVVIRFSYRYYLLRRASPDFNPDPAKFRRSVSTFLSDLIPAVSMLRGIATTAPFLGLAGTSYGILAGLSFGYSGSRSRFLAILCNRIAGALVWAAAGILVAIPGALFHPLLRTRIEALSLLRSRRSGNGKNRGSVPFAQALPLKKQLSAPPAYALLAVPTLACILLIFTPFHPYRVPLGLSVALPSTRCDYDRHAPDRIVVLRVANTGEVFINMEPEDWKNLRHLLDKIYRARENRELYLLAEDELPFQTVANAIDIVKNSPGPGEDSLGIKIVLITPNAAQECLMMPVRIIPLKTGSQIGVHIPVALTIPLR